MENPWLNIPLDDYEGHMALPHVAQAQMLSNIFDATLKKHRPASVAMLGCAGGNGFEHIQPDVTPRVVGIDINPHYIQAARDRFERQIPALELYAADLQTMTVSFAPVDLLFAGLLLEYVPPSIVFERARHVLRPNGLFVTVVQLPSDECPEVTPSPFTSLGELASAMQLVDPGDLRQEAQAQGFRQTEEHIEESAGGKRFHVQEFEFEATREE